MDGWLQSGLMDYMTWLPRLAGDIQKFRRQGGLAGMMGQEPVQTKMARLMENKGTQEDLMDVYGGFMGIMAGPGAKTANLMKLRLAKRMAKAGASKEAIWQKTGWFTGADKKWRFEIPDEAAVADPGRAYGSAEQVMHHPELYKAYPELRKLSWTNSSPAGAGRYDPGWPGIDVGAGPVSKRTGVGLHELQHAVQHREGFAAGGSFKTAEDLAEPLKWRHREIQGEIWKIGDAKGLSAAYKKFKLNQLNRQAENLQKQIKSLENPTDVYKRLMGEVEARNVEARAGQVPQLPPWKTQEYPEWMQIYRAWDTPWMFNP